MPLTDPHPSNVTSCSAAFSKRRGPTLAARSTALALVWLAAGGATTGGPDAASPDVVGFELVPIARGLARPVAVTHAGDGSQRLFVVEKPGRVRVVRDGRLLPQPFLDITTRVNSSGEEQGLLGLAFHPSFEANSRFFVHYTRADGAVVVAMFTGSFDDPDVADGASERVLMTIPHPGSTDHNGGQLAFGPDGFLYVAVGDGGFAGDPSRNAQNRESLLGKILRVDVDVEESPYYRSPPDSPFAGATPGRDEIYALGFRNPWRFSFDRVTGDLWAGDVGQYCWEEIDRVVRGGNYGWNALEGDACFDPLSQRVCSSTDCDRSGYEPPVFVYDHSGGVCAITGGYVYRGTRSSAFAGTYVFADYCLDVLWGLRDGVRTDLIQSELALHVTSFGEDEAGEIYVVTDSVFGGSGSLSRLAPPACALTCPEPLTVTDLDGDGLETVSFPEPVAEGVCGDVACSPAAGSVFQLGATTVACVSASAGAACSFTVVVQPRGGAPAVTSCSPSGAPRRATLDVIVSGAGFAEGASVSLGPGVRVLAVTFVSATEIRVSVKVKRRAALRPRTVTVTNPNGTSAAARACFEVTRRA